MCGITGCWQSRLDREETLTRTIGAMNETLVHRGPDDGGTWVDPERGIALGNRRLAILDLSPAGHQPMVSADGRFVLAYNGEVYNFKALRKDLEAEGSRFRSHTDTEVVLEACARWGVEVAVARFIGMFAFALWDRQQCTLTLVRDRLGIKPLYYGWSGGTFLFGSELKALVVHPDFVREVDRDSLALYLRHNYVPAPHSIYRGIYKLPPGHSLKLGQPGERAAPWPYWSAKAVAERGQAEPLAADEAELAQRLDALLREAVRLRMIADVPLGVFLSGGVDSSTVAALMQAQSDRPVRTFSIGFHETEYDEAPHAKAVAHHLGTDHTELYVTPQQAQQVIPRLAEIYDEPFADSSQIPTFLVSQLTRAHVVVSLSGDGGDELFGGYNRYFLGRALWGKLRWLPPPLKALGARGIRSLSPQSWNAFFGRWDGALPRRLKVRTPGDKLYKLAEILEVRTPEAMYHRLVSHWKDPGAVVLQAREPRTVLTDRAQWACLKDFTERMMFLDLVTYLPDDILTKVDRASMAVGLEARVPLLDHRVVAFAWRVPLSHKVRDGRGKHLLRRVLYRYVPESLIERPKMGFGVPLDHWLRGPLRAWAEDLLSEERLRREGFFDPASVRRRWAEHLSGKRNWQYHLWDILMFQAWQERWLR